jgi:hypothetical protein
VRSFVRALRPLQDVEEGVERRPGARDDRRLASEVPEAKFVLVVRVRVVADGDGARGDDAELVGSNPPRSKHVLARRERNLAREPLELGELRGVKAAAQVAQLQSAPDGRGGGGGGGLLFPRAV